MLFEPDRHEPLAGPPWSEARARAAIARIVADARADFSEDGLWPIHPFDVSPERPASMKPLYYGAAGVIWALDRLARAGAVEPGPSFLAVVRDLPRRHREDLAASAAVGGYLGEAIASYQMGEAGMRMLEWKLAPSQKVAHAIAAALEAKLGDARGLVWGAAGAMTAALLMHRATGEGRWGELYLRHFEALWARWAWSDALGCHAWTDELYGVTETRLGALHGLVANALAMMRGRDLLVAELRDEALDRIWRALRATALVEGHAANWPHNVGASNRPEPMPLLVQFCSGAPGAIACLGAFPKDDLRWPVDGLLRQAGELVWRAGPASKLPGLCHGAPGAGYAFLKLFERSGDELWLERARTFAMHAIGQAEQALATYGQRKWSLWTGDMGLAVYLSDCIEGNAAFPTLDVF